MKKIILLPILVNQLLWSASSSQIEQYLSVSGAEEELVELESGFSSMQKSFNKNENNASKTYTSYDMQMLSIRFKHYLQKSISEDEMEAVLKNYRSIVLLQFVSARKSAEFMDPDALKKNYETETENLVSKSRVDLIEKINEKLNNKEFVAIMFDKLMLPLLKNGPGGENLNDAFLKERKEKYMERVIEYGKYEIYYLTKEFTDEELKRLLKIAQTPAMEYEIKAVYGGMAYALQEFFFSLSGRFDVSKHQ